MARRMLLCARCFVTLSLSSSASSLPLPCLLHTYSSRTTDFILKTCRASRLSTPRLQSPALVVRPHCRLRWWENLLWRTTWYESRLATGRSYCCCCYPYSSRSFRFLLFFRQYFPDSVYASIPSHPCLGENTTAVVFGHRRVQTIQYGIILLYVFSVRSSKTPAALTMSAV